MFQGVLSSKLRCVSKNNPVSQFQCLTSLSKKASRAWQLNFAHQMQTRMHLGILSPIHLVIGKSKIIRSVTSHVILALLIGIAS